MMQSAQLLIARVSDDRYLFKYEPPNAAQANPAAHLTGMTTIDEQIHQQLTNLLDLLVQELRLLSAPTASKRRADTNGATPLEQLGRTLYAYLLPPVFRTALRNLPAPSPLVLLSNDTQFPWELLHDGENYLALKHAVSRQLLHTEAIPQFAQKPAADNHFLFVGNPTGDLTEAAVEVEALIDLCDSLLEPIDAHSLNVSRATKAAVLQELAGSNNAVFHYSGHALPHGLQLADGLLTTSEIAQTVSGRPFVFVNGCQSAQAVRADTVASADEEVLPYVGLNMRNLASTFLLNGAQAFVGSLWDIFDESSRLFAEQFYEQALTGVPIGEALRLARLYLYERDRQDPLWASYVLYGDPMLRLLTQHKHEKRQVAIQTIQLQGMAALYEGYTLERAVELRQQLVSQLTAVAQRFGGQLQGEVADTLSFCFGFPHKQEDDASRACLAASELLGEVRRFNQLQNQQAQQMDDGRLTVQIGIATGHLFVSQKEGMPTQLAGPVMTEAAALAALAQPNQIVVNPATRQMAGQQLDFASTDEGYDLFVGRGQRLITGQLVGREEELGQLGEWWREMASGRGRVVHLIGAAGIGKSVLAQSFVATAERQGARPINTRCDSLDKETPNALIAQLVRQLIGAPEQPSEQELQSHLNQTVESVLARAREKDRQDALYLLGQLLGVAYPETDISQLEPNLRQNKLTRLLQALLAQQAGQRPLLIVVDDLHQADSSSLEMLGVLFNSVERMAIMVLILYRPSWQQEWVNWRHSRTVMVRELDKTDEERLLSQLLGEKPFPAALLDMVGQAAGNPFFLEEMIREWQETALLVETDGEWQMRGQPESYALPNTVENVLATRLDRLSEAGKDLLRQAAVIGDLFELGMLEQLQPAGAHMQLEETLHLLAERDFVYTHSYWPEVTYAFRHGLIRQVVYDSMAGRTRQILHRLVGYRLLAGLGQEHEQPIQAIAHHFHLGDDRPQAVQSCLAAAEATTAVGANQIGLEWYMRAAGHLAALRSLPAEQLQKRHALNDAVLQQWERESATGNGDCLTALGQNDEAIASYVQAQKLTADVLVQADLQHKIGVAYHNKGELDTAEEAFQAGLSLLDGRVCVEAGRLTLWSSLAHFRRGQLQVGLDVCVQGIVIIEQTDNKQLLAQAFNLQGLLYRNLGQSDEALQAHEQSIELYDVLAYPPGLERAYSNKGCVLQDLSQWDEALYYFQESVRLSGETGETWRQAAAAINVGEIYRLQNQLEEAVLAFEQALALSEEHAFQEIAAAALLNLGDSYRRQGEADPAAQALARAAEIIEAIGVDFYKPSLLYYQAQVQRLNGAWSAAETLAAEAQRLAVAASNQLVVAQTGRLLGQIYQAQGKLEAADGVLKESLEQFEQQNNRFEIGLTCLAVAELKAQLADEADGEVRESSMKDGLPYVERALEIFTQVGARQELQRAAAIQASWTHSRSVS